MAFKADPYAGIEFDEINEVTGLEVDEVKCLKNCFDLFDSKKQEFLSADDLARQKYIHRHPCTQYYCKSVTTFTYIFLFIC